jgi:hypothetical protein
MTTITFEDLPLRADDFVGAAPTEYGGFVWSNWNSIYDAQMLRDGKGVPSGYLSADASGPKALIGGPQSMIGSYDGSEFDFQSGYFTSAWKDGATFTVTGYHDGAQVAVQSFTIGTSGSLYVQFTSDFDRVDELAFQSVGGIANGFGNGNYFVVDDLLLAGPVAVPGPIAGEGMVGLLIGACALLGYARRRFKRGSEDPAR